jgi:DnaJ-class molecular chaperone
MGYYEDLQIDKNSTQDEIKKAFRKLSLKYHPDKQTGDAEKFKCINEAYQTLGDENKRKMYDMQGNMGNGMMGTHPMEHIFKAQFGGGGGDIGPGGDLFKMFFNGMPMNEDLGGAFNNNPFINISRNRKPSPINKTIEITLQGAFEGMTYPVLIERTIIGQGMKRSEKETVYIDIPPGVDNNEIVVVSNKGNIIMDKQGDIKLYIKIKNETCFQRKGLHLIYKKDITLKEALTNFATEFEHINGKKYKLDHCGKSTINPGQETKIQGLGMIRGNNKGSLIVIFNINFPKSLTEEQKDKLKEIL